MYLLLSIIGLAALILIAFVCGAIAVTYLIKERAFDVLSDEEYRQFIDLSKKIF